eukprot:s4273_g2.t2
MEISMAADRQKVQEAKMNFEDDFESEMPVKICHLGQAAVAALSALLLGFLAMLGLENSGNTAPSEKLSGACRLFRVHLLGASLASFFAWLVFEPGLEFSLAACAILMATGAVGTAVALDRPPSPSTQYQNPSVNVSPPEPWMAEPESSICCRAPAPPPVTRVMPSAPPAAVSRLARAQRTERVERIEREERPERVERVERTEKTASTRKSIRVCNVPKNLDDRDIQEAFEDIGRVTKCEVERGVAVITFANSAHAKKAVQTFDRGELNGQTIYVSIEG